MIVDGGTGTPGIFPACTIRFLGFLFTMGSIDHSNSSHPIGKLPNPTNNSSNRSRASFVRMVSEPSDSLKSSTAEKSGLICAGACEIAMVNAAANRNGETFGTMLHNFLIDVL